MKPIALLIALVLVSGIAFSYLPTPSEDEDDEKLSMFVSVDPSCDGHDVRNVLSVVDKDGLPVPGAHIAIKRTSDAALIAFGDTDAAGQFAFIACGYKVDIKASEPDHKGNYSVVMLEPCETCAGCLSDDDCPDNQYCDAGDCITVPCECGIVKAHECSPYECCSDSDCAENEECENHACVAIPPEPEDDDSCGKNTDCADNEYCRIPAGAGRGDCVPVEGCGSVSNHTLAPYRCGNATGCPSCSFGYTCVDNECVPDDISCPPTGTAGAGITCNATTGGAPCRNCDYAVTDPSGNDTGGRTDGEGKLRLPLGMRGNYSVSLLRNGTVVKTVAVTALAAAGGDEGKDTGLFSSPIVVAGLLLIVLLLAGVAIYFLRRGGSGKKYKGRKD